MLKKITVFLPSLILLLICQNAYSKELWSEIRKSFRLRDYSYIPQVRNQINWIKEHPTYLTSFSENSNRYIYYVLEEIKKRGLPGELALMPMIESNYNPFAYSTAGAAGLWQLMPGTGSGLGIKQDWWYEGRRDIKPSTNAALTYLQYLGNFFNNQWLLAIAAYDSGEGTVLNSVKKNQNLRQKTDFWSLSLPRETQAYLPRLLALASIIRSPNYYKIALPKQTYAPYFDEIEITEQLDLDTAAKMANISYAELLNLNPGHNRWTTAPNHKTTLLLPIESINHFHNKLKTLSKQDKMAWSRHIINKGDTLSEIAKNQKSSVQVIKDINKLKSDLIKPGQELYIPATKKITDKTANNLRQKIRDISNEQNNRGPYKIIHVARSGESFSSLEKKYHVKASAIRYWNQLTNAKELKSGQKLIIWINNHSNKRTYQVKENDTFGSIALKHHLSISELKKLNPQLKDVNHLKIKQKLFV